MSNERTSLRRVPRKAAVIVAAALILVFGFVLASRASRSQFETQIEELRKAGLPTTAAELNAWYPKVPDSNNAALVIVKAVDQRVRPTPELVALSLPEAGQALSGEATEAIKEHVEANEEALESLHRAALLTTSRYPIDLSPGANALLPHLANVKSLAQLLRYESVYYSIEGKPDLAFRSVVSNFALARTLRNEPTVISELVRIACVAISVSSLEFLMAEHPLTNEELNLMGALLEETEEDRQHAGFRAVTGERSGALSYFGAAGVDIHQQLGLATGGKEAPARVLFNAYQAFGFAERDLRLYLDVIEDLASAMTNSFPEAYQMSRETERKMNDRFSNGLGRFAMLSRGLLPSLVKVFGKEASLATRLRCARAAVAVEKHRLVNGSLPTTLAELVPSTLPEVPIDPVEGKPLEFRTNSSGAGFQIYSSIAASELKNKRETQFGVYRRSSSDSASEAR